MIVVPSDGSVVVPPSVDAAGVVPVAVNFAALVDFVVGPMWPVPEDETLSLVVSTFSLASGVDCISVETCVWVSASFIKPTIKMKTIDLTSIIILKSIIAKYSLHSIREGFDMFLR